MLQFERLYFGVLVTHPKAPPGPIARSANIVPEHVTECVRVAQLAPPPSGDCTDEMPGALGLFRGESGDFILAKAQINDAGLPQVLYLRLPLAALRTLGGNVLTFRALGMMDMPSFSALKQDLMPFELRDPHPPTEAEQTDALLDLILYCQDSFKNVEGILAGLVQGWPLAVINSPPSLEKRLRFVQGVLSLLPLPARIGITFVTQVRDLESSRAQIKFTSQHSVPDNHVVYDWQAGQLLTAPPEDSYSHYMVAQLRLDPSLVIEQTTELSRTAIWRAKHRENLGRALAWVSRRAAIDQTVLEGQPTDRELVAAILREDPTLSDELRLAYVRHLLAFTLVPKEQLEPADIIPIIAVTSPEIAESVTDQLQTALDKGQAEIVYSLLERWLLHIPEASALNWHTMLHSAAVQRLESMLDQKPQAIAFLNYAHQAPPSLKFEMALPDLIRTAQPAAANDPDLAQVLFLLATEALHAGEFQRLVKNTAFASQLPEATQTAIRHLQAQRDHPAPPHVLAAGARVFGDGHRMLVLARLVEWAMFLQRLDLIDTEALHALLVLAQSPHSERFEILIQHVVNDFNDVAVIQALEPPGPRILIQLLLQTCNFDHAVGMLEFYQNTLFGPDRLEAFTELVEEVFLMTALPAEDLSEALTHLEGSQIRLEPRAMIYCAALENNNWSTAQDYAARRLTTLLFNDSHLVSVIGHENALKVVDYHNRAENTLDALRVGAAIVDAIQATGTEGAIIVSRIWAQMRADKAAAEGALELLRRFVRAVSLEHVPRLLAYFEDELGSEVAQALHATYMMRQAMGEADLLQFAKETHFAAHLLMDIAAIYHTNKELPPNHRLRRDLDAMSGNLTDQERDQIAENTLTLAHQIYTLGQDRARRRRRPDITEQLIQGNAIPQNGVDLLRFIGGHFASHEVFPPDLEREAMAHLFGNRSAAMYLRESHAVTRLLNGLHLAFQEKDLYPMSPQELIGELDSLWTGLSLYNQRLIKEELARDCQQLAEVITIMAEGANERILSDGGPGRQLETGQRQPRTSLEALRWVNGYFARKHIRTRS
jgi:hypothetical protein